MKKQFFFAVLMTLCILCAAASADPVITDREATAWIAENNYLYLQNAEGRISQMPLEMADLLQMTKDELICQTKDGRTIAVKKDGTGSRTVDPGAELPQDTRVELSAEGVLRLNGSVISNSAVQAVNDGVFLYYTERMGALYLLRVSPMQNDMQPLTLGSRDANAAALTGKSIPEPLNLTVSKDAVVLTTTDHRVIVMDLNKGTTEELAALSRETLSACMVNDVVYRYHHANDRTWVIESGVAETAATMKPAATETMKPAETAQPTAPPRPAATAKPAENKSGNESLIDDDGTIHYGARGNTVKKIDDAPYCVFDMYMPLKKGDKGGNVRLMQKRLKDLGYDPGTVDGSYGKNTVAAVARFQAAYDIAREANEKPGEVASRDMLITLYATDTKPQIGTAASIDGGASNFK